MTWLEQINSVDLVDPETFQSDLRDFWQTLRDELPVYRHPGRAGSPPFWVLSRHSDIMAVYRDNRNFTSERGNILLTLLAGGDSASGKMLAVTDGARHRELRAIVQSGLSPRVLSYLSARIDENTRTLVRRCVTAGTCDFASEVAEKVPLGTVADLLGVPAADRDFLLRNTKIALSSDTGGQSAADAWCARNTLLEYFLGLIPERRARPGDDVISVLAGGRIDGRPLNDRDIVLNCYSLILGGDETSRLSMNEAIRALVLNPDQWRALKDGEVELASATEEVLRWATPTMHFGRTAAADVVVGDVRIAAGEVVTLWNSSANRDERVFTHPYSFVLGRAPNKHVTFGYGPHFCIGAYLARMEISALLGALRDHAATFEIAGPVQHIHSNFLTGISRLPMRFTAGERARTAAAGRSGG